MPDEERVKLFLITVKGDAVDGVACEWIQRVIKEGLFDSMDDVVVTEIDKTNDVVENLYRLAVEADEKGHIDYSTGLREAIDLINSDRIDV